MRSDHQVGTHVVRDRRVAKVRWRPSRARDAVADARHPSRVQRGRSAGDHGLRGQSRRGTSVARRPRDAQHDLARRDRHRPRAGARGSSAAPDRDPELERRRPRHASLPARTRLARPHLAERRRRAPGGPHQRRSDDGLRARAPPRRRRRPEVDGARAGLVHRHVRVRLRHRRSCGGRHLRARATDVGRPPAGHRGMGTTGTRCAIERSRRAARQAEAHACSSTGARISSSPPGRASRTASRPRTFVRC